jgi:uncharacterized circularly permuted ATP-grasp superfamily protein
MSYLSTVFQCLFPLHAVLALRLRRLQCPITVLYLNYVLKDNMRKLDSVYVGKHFSTSAGGKKPPKSEYISVCSFQLSLPEKSNALVV